MIHRNIIVRFFFIVLLSFSDVYAADDVHYLKQLKNRNYQFLSYGIMIAIIGWVFNTQFQIKNDIRNHGRYRITIYSNTGKISYTDGEIQRLIIMEKFRNLSYDEENRGSTMEAIHRQPQKKMEAAYESAENIYTYSGGSTDGCVWPLLFPEIENSI